MTFSRDGFWADSGRFAVAGIVNTLLSLVVYQAALFVLPPSYAYALAWAVGIAFVLATAPSRVFRGSKVGPGTLALLAAIYISAFLVGITTLQILLDQGLHPRLAVLAVLALTASLNFTLSRLLLRR